MNKEAYMCSRAEASHALQVSTSSESASTADLQVPDHKHHKSIKGNLVGEDGVCVPVLACCDFAELSITLYAL